MGMIRIAGVVVGVLMGGVLCAQSARSQFPWWNSPIVNDLNLTDAQTKQIEATVSEYRTRLRELRAAVNKADTDLQNAFNEDPVDQHKAGQAIEDLANARGELTKTLSQMDLKLRTVLTAQQWQDLQARQRERQAQRVIPGRRRRGLGAKGELSKGDLAPAEPPVTSQK